VQEDVCVEFIFC